MSSYPGGVTIVAHIIVGRKPEPYLSAALESLAPVCAHAVINDNSGAADGPNAQILAACRFAADRRITIMHTSFADFASARNVCIDATPAPLRSGWAVRIDADEVFDASLAALAAIVPRIPAVVDVVDCYSRHFIGSFSYFDEIARQLCLFRLDRSLRWRLPVHEQLVGVRRRIVIPALLYHYGHVVPPDVEERRGKLYSSLGQPAPAPVENAGNHTVSSMWGRLLRRAIAYNGRHPAAARATLAALTSAWLADFAEVDALVAKQNLADRINNALRAANYRRLLWWRSNQAWLRWGWRSPR
jgi:hypothetical protein